MNTQMHVVDGRWTFVQQSTAKGKGGGADGMEELENPKLWANLDDLRWWLVGSNEHSDACR